MSKRMTVKQVNERVDLLRKELDEVKGELEAHTLNTGISKHMSREKDDGLEEIVNRLLERVKRLENKVNKKSRWKFWQRRTKN